VQKLVIKYDKCVGVLLMCNSLIRRFYFYIFVSILATCSTFHFTSISVIQYMNIVENRENSYIYIHRHLSFGKCLHLMRSVVTHCSCEIVAVAYRSHWLYSGTIDVERSTYLPTIKIRLALRVRNSEQRTDYSFSLF